MGLVKNARKTRSLSRQTLRVLPRVSSKGTTTVAPLLDASYFDGPARWARFLAWAWAQQEPPVDPCAHGDARAPGSSGGCEGDVRPVIPMTRYGDEPDAYRLCDAHAKDYVHHWTEMWAEYHASVL